MIDFLHIDTSVVHPALLFSLLFAGTFFSEDAACLAAGALVVDGRLGFAPALMACFLGIFAGDIALYWTGRIFGRRVLRARIIRRFVSEDAVDRASNWLEMRGASAVFLSRFVTGLRLPTYFAAGLFRTDFLKFALYFLLAAAIWTPILVGSAAFSLNAFSQNFLLGSAAAFLAIRLITKFTSWKNRRLLVGRIRRIVNWEFWPVQVFYLPIVFHILRLAVRHRSLTVFTCVNPAIPASGFTGESKNDIYLGLARSGPAQEYLLKHTLIEHDCPAALAQARKFIEENSLSFPLVLKPNAGERGKGVRMIHSFDKLKECIRTLKTDFILQEYFGGEEASIFYYRSPSQEKGHIFSITEKRFPRVKGDGISDLETLILRDKRAVCLAQSYIDQNRERLHEIPANGEEIQMIDIGTHSRGAIFLDGEWMITPELETKIDEICRAFEGFYFGRFDIRCESFESLMRGKDFRIVELNGVTSESTNIYDPRHSLIGAYRILFRQWDLAFEIGSENYRRGARRSSAGDLVRLVLGGPMDRKREFPALSA